jgi:hypothetical protein
MLFGKVGKMLMILGWIYWLLSCAFPSAHAADFVEFGAIRTSVPVLGSDLSLGFGASLTVDVYQKFSIESGLIYMGRAFSRNSADHRLKTIQIPLLVRYRMHEFWSAAAGGYYSHGIGNLVLIQNSQSHIVGYSDLSLNKEDIGVLASVRFQRPIHEVLQLVLDGRLLFGATNIDLTGKGSVYLRDLQLWVGVAFNL